MTPTDTNAPGGPRPQNTFQRLGQSPTGAYHCDTAVDADGHVTQTWRHATQAEADALASPLGDPNHPAYRHRIFGYEPAALLSMQYKINARNRK